MNDKFELLKLNRGVWIALLSQFNILEGISSYDKHIALLEEFGKKNKNYTQKITEEIEICKRTIIKALIHIAKTNFSNEDYANALICYTKIFQLDTQNTEILQNYLACLNHEKLNDLAEIVLKTIIQNNPNNLSLYPTYADNLNKAGKPEKAVQCMEEYLKRKNVSEINEYDYNSLGCYAYSIYQKTHEYCDIKKSLDYFIKAAKLAPYSKLYSKNVTIIASQANEHEICKEYWNKVFKIGGLSNDDKYDYSLFSLKTKNYKGWHDNFDARFLKETNSTRFPQFKKPKWNGEDLAEKTLLIHYEQGFGDSLLMFGFIPRLVKMAKNIIFVVQDELFELFNNSGYDIEVISSYEDITNLDFDYYIPSMSIPIVMKYKGKELSVGEKYIKVNEQLVEKFKKQYFNNNKFKIGISFAGNCSGDKTRDASIDEFLKLEKLDNIEIYSLIKDAKDEDFKNFKKHKVHNLGKIFKSFADTAAAMENCDLIITTDNCILNLAGALGKKTYGLFNWCYAGRWYDLTKKDCGWFTSVKPFINDKMDNWSSSISKAIEEINI